MSPISRRRFIKTAAAASIATPLLFPAHSRAIGANDDVRVAVIGLRWRGGDHIQTFVKGVPGARLAAICDLDPAILGREADKLDKLNFKCDKTTDARKLLDRKDI